MESGGRSAGHRSGAPHRSARTVIAYRLLSRGTVEERVAELQKQKRELVDALFGEGAMAQKLTREDLEALLDVRELASSPSDLAAREGTGNEHGAEPDSRRLAWRLLRGRNSPALRAAGDQTIAIHRP